MLQTLGHLTYAAVLGVFAASIVTCIVGLSCGTGTWCGLPYYWIVGAIPAIATALVLGYPGAIAYRKLGLRRWWQFFLGGIVIALPVWYEFAQPFSSPRWVSAGFFDSLIYLGSGGFGGVAFWLLSSSAKGDNAL